MHIRVSIDEAGSLLLLCLVVGLPEADQRRTRGDERAPFRGERASDTIQLIRCDPSKRLRARTRIPGKVEHSGTKRGERLNKASVSSKHSLALVNRGGATADDVLCLAALVADRVKTKFDIQLKMEPETIGFDDINDSRLFKIKPV
ncbi:hypothetical protein EB061_07280 [bacterium]|nr:hypothetical protein [bacterium]